MMTDGLAQWFLQKTEHHQKPWRDLLAMATPEVFEVWIKYTRDRKELRNDDVSLIIIG
jgi:hypothetical protein